MNEFERFEESVNRSRAEEGAKFIKEYCRRHRICNECVFYIGTCKLTMHPSDWDFRKENR